MRLRITLWNAPFKLSDVKNLKAGNENNNRRISAESKEEADKLFNGLLAGGQIEMPIEESPRRSYFGIFRDRYGIEWMVDFDSEIKGQTPLIMAEEKGSKETIDILTKKEGK